MKKCPYCAEEIQDEAIVCKHCGREVIEDRWREYCARYAQLAPEQQRAALAKLTAEQRAQAERAWKALGYAERRQQAASAVRDSRRSSSMPVVGCLVLVILASALYIAAEWNRYSGSPSVGSSASRPPDVIDDSYRLCAAMEKTGLTTQCTVEGWGKTVDVTIDTTGAEARKICAGVADLMAAETSRFAGQWKLRIFSPYSGERPIATCALH